MKNKKAKASNVMLGVVVVILIMLMVGMFGYFIYIYQKGTSQSAVQQTQETITQASETSKIGKASTIKVDVVDVSSTSPTSTKLAVAIYCIDDQGNFILDGTTSSTSTATSGQTTIGKTISCYAFNTTVQTLKDQNTDPNRKYFERYIDEETEQISIQAYVIPTNAKIQTYTDSLTTGTGGVVNVTGAGADSTGTMDKVRITNNITNTIYPLGGIYFQTVSGTNVSSVDIEGTASLHLKGSAWLPKVLSGSFVKSELPNSVSSRNDNWENVYEISTGDTTGGKNTALLLEGGDYVESTTVSVKGDGDGCGTSASDLISPKIFPKGYFRATKTSTVLYGHQTDASSSSLLVAEDEAGDTFYCLA